jgi:hypothetical protein
MAKAIFVFYNDIATYAAAAQNSAITAYSLSVFPDEHPERRPEPPQLLKAGPPAPENPTSGRTIQLGRGVRRSWNIQKSSKNSRYVLFSCILHLSGLNAVRPPTSQLAQGDYRDLRSGLHRQADTDIRPSAV